MYHIWCLAHDELVHVIHNIIGRDGCFVGEDYASPIEILQSVMKARWSMACPSDKPLLDAALQQ